MIKGIRRFLSHCSGCGAPIQHQEPHIEGFIPEHKFKNILIQNEKTHKILEGLSDTGELKLKDFSRVYRDQDKSTEKSTNSLEREIIARKARRESKKEKETIRNLIRKDKKLEQPYHIDVNDIEEIELFSLNTEPLSSYTKKPTLKELICMRCFKLSKYGEKTDIQTSITSADPLKILNYIFSSMKNHSVILKIVDLIDFNGSFIQEIYTEASKKHCHMILIANKIDVLPKEYKYSRIHSWVKRQVQSYFDDQSICVVSSKTGEGFGRVLHLLRTLNKKYPKSTFYVLGSTNSGKSSFLNKLVRRTWNLPETNLKLPVLADTLTTSIVPGTTLNMIPVSCRSLSLKLIDTPGIPTLSQYSAYAEHSVLSALVPSKRLQSLVILCHPGQCVWIGGLARIDVLSGNYLYFTFFTSPLVTIHKTNLGLKDDIYRRQAGKLLSPIIEKLTLDAFVSEKVVVKGTGREKACKDLVFHGLGWVAVSGIGETEIEVHFPGKVGFNVREPLMPYEYSLKTVQKQKAKTFRVAKNS